jgi:hypothetical protein
MITCMVNDLAQPYGKEVGNRTVRPALTVQQPHGKVLTRVLFGLVGELTDAWAIH